MRRRSLVLSLLATPALRALGQSSRRIIRLGYLGAGSPEDYWQALAAGLKELGYVEGSNLVIERRWAGNEDARMPALAAELVSWKADVIATQGTPATLAAKGATQSIPIVMLVIGD